MHFIQIGDIFVVVTINMDDKLFLNNLFNNAPWACSVEIVSNRNAVYGLHNSLFSVSSCTKVFSIGPKKPNSDFQVFKALVTTLLLFGLHSCFQFGVEISTILKKEEGKWINEHMVSVS